MFEDVLGQSAAKHYLQALQQGGRIPHGLLLYGPPRVGKFALAHSFVKAVNCRNDRHGKCFCTSCQKINEGCHPDVHCITPNDNGRITIDQIRTLESVFQYKRNEGTRKMAIVKNAHRLNQQSANALLKTLEEPSADTTIVLTTSKADSLYDTIRSRCQGVRFSFLSDADIATLLDRDTLPGDDITISMMAGSYVPERIQSNLILTKHIWDGSYVDLPAKIEPGQLRAELSYLATVFSYLLRTGGYAHKEIVVARANSERMTNLFYAVDQGLAYLNRGVRPFLVIQWCTHRMREVLV